MSEFRPVTYPLPTRPRVKYRFERIAVIGLGSVGFPLGISLAQSFYQVVGFDISKRRIAALRSGHDATGAIHHAVLADTTLRISGDPADLAQATVYIVAVPTPTDPANRPDLTALTAACELVGSHLKRGDLVVFQSVVHPGVTEEYCGQILSQVSGLASGVDFNLGCSPDRSDAGDRVHRLDNTVRTVAADSAAALDRVAAVYDKVVTAGLYRAASIRVAEAAKLLENTQRDVNIAVMNEMALICAKIGISTREVIDAAASKWNFVPYQPGLGGGQGCGVNPAGLPEHPPSVIHAARQRNDGMAGHIASVALGLLAKRGGDLCAARVGLFGIAARENTADLQNSGAVALLHALQAHGLDLRVHDAAISAHEAARAGILLSPLADMQDLDMMILAVPHAAYLVEQGFLGRIGPAGIVMDVKSVFRRQALPDGCQYWAL